MKKNAFMKTLILLLAASFVLSGLFLSCGKQEEEKKPAAAAAPAEEPKAPEAKKVLIKVPICFATSLSRRYPRPHRCPPHARHQISLKPTMRSSAP